MTLFLDKLAPFSAKLGLSVAKYLPGRYFFDKNISLGDIWLLTSFLSYTNPAISLDLRPFPTQRNVDPRKQFLDRYLFAVSTKYLPGYTTKTYGHSSPVADQAERLKAKKIAFDFTALARFPLYLYITTGSAPLPSRNLVGPYRLYAAWMTRAASFPPSNQRCNNLLVRNALKTMSSSAYFPLAALTNITRCRP